jgi:hypothetical protein
VSARLIAVALLVLLAGCAGHDESIEAACTELVLDYAYHRDRLDPDAVAALFSDDATMSVLGDVYNGRAAIKQRMIDGRGGPVTRHLMSTIRIFPIDRDRATGVSYATVYMAPRNDTDNPLTVEGFAGIGEYHDEFVRTAEGWKIKVREFRPVFTYADQ